MTSRLDYLKKYLSKSDAKQLKSQIDKGEQIKIRNSTKLRRRKVVGKKGIVISNPERDPAHVRDSQSSESSDEDGPIVVSYRDDSRESLKRKWNPISSAGSSRVRARHDSDEEVSRRRHDSDSDTEVTRDVQKQSDMPNDSQKELNDSDSDIDVKRKSTDTVQHRQQKKKERKSRWSRDEKNTSENLSCAVLLQGNESNDTVYRSKEGYKVEIDKDTAAKDKEKAEKDANFKIMKEGFVQASMHQEKVENFVKESQKGLARYVGDESMNEFLKSKQLVDDPLIKMKRKKAKKNRLKKRCKPTYQGNFPSNRFNIRPGYRWDGVDRSNGYEKERFRIINDRKADVDEFYKWSTEDM